MLSSELPIYDPDKYPAQRDEKSSTQVRALKSLTPPKNGEVVTLSEEDGAIVKKTFKEMDSSEIIKANEKSIRVLTNISAHVKNPKAVTLDKEAKKTYKFYKANVLKVGGKPDHVQKERFVKSLDDICLALTKGTDESEVKKLRSEIVIQELGLQDADYREKLTSQLRHIDGDYVKTNSVGPDIFRHITSGFIELASSRDPDIFATAGLDRRDLTLLTDEKEVEERKKLELDRVNVYLHQIAVACKPTDEQIERTKQLISSGQGQIKEKASVSEIRRDKKELETTVEERFHSEILGIFESELPNLNDEKDEPLSLNSFEGRLDSGLQRIFERLSKGNRRQKDAARLMFANAQSFYLGTARARVMLYKHEEINKALAPKDGDVSKELRFIAIDHEGKQINYFFSEDGGITVTQRVRYIHKDPKGGPPQVAMEQVTELASRKDHLDSWTMTDKVEIHVPKGQSPDMAERLATLYDTLEFPYEVMED